MRKIKILVAFSGGKDSLASLIWAVRESGFKKENIEAVFCDTGWEHEVTYKHIVDVTDRIGVKLVTLKSKKYAGMVDLAVQKKRFPSTMARFCTEELKTKPMIDYILDECDCNVIVIQGIRKDESKSRSLMKNQCTYFRYYYEPYGNDKHGKPKFHTYRKKDVLEFRKNHLDDVLRPCFDWTGNDVMTYILDNGFRPNDLYFHDMKRVGCFPCIMTSKKELKAIIKHYPETIDKLEEVEEEVDSSFFPPKYIPKRYRTGVDKNGKTFPFIKDVVRYMHDKSVQIELFKEDKDENRSCMSVYGICE